jgi:hypothetical protein
MLSKEDFIRRILDGAALAPKKVSKAASPTSFSADDVFGSDDAGSPSSIPPPADTRFAQLLLEEVFGHGEAQPRNEIVLGEQKTSRFLPNAGIYWPKTNERPFHVVLFELDKKGRELLAERFFGETDQLEDALHRIVQDVLEGFEKKRAASTRQGQQTETLCVVSIVDDRATKSGRQLVCFGTKSTETKALEVFTLREEVRDWDRPLAEEHLDQLFERHFKKLASGAKWQDAFITGDERKKIKLLLEACTTPSLFGNNEEELRKKLRDVLDEIAGSFGIWKKSANQNRRLDMIELPANHGIGADPSDAQKPGFKNPLQGVRIYDRNERLLGFIVYVASTKAKVEPLRQALATNNHFHNVLVIYPDSAEPELELWQGSTPLRGRLTRGPKRTQFDGEGGVVQLLSRFFVVSKSAIEKPKQLAEELAWRAQHLKALAVEELEKEIESGNDTGPLKKLFDTFNAALATLTVAKFADAYAQTITYGMLAARWISSGESPLFTRKNLKDLLPETSAFLKDLFDKLVNSNFDKNLTWMLDDITSLLARTSVAQVFRDEKRDPSIHFYEDFLDAYDPQVRKDQGVYYTPDEVVSYIVRTVHSALQNDFGLPLGLADTTTWADFAKAKKLAMPEGVDPKSPFVQVLDPALGTGTFLLRVIEVIHDTMTAAFKKQGLDEEAAKKAWVSYVRRDLLPRINGFELMMAPYIVSHLRLGLALQETGFAFTKNDRLRVFLTNSLEPHTAAQLSFIGEHVAEEAKEAERAKKSIRVTVVVGNPPYAGHSQNNGEWARGLVEPYRSIDGKALRLAQGKWLQNDYVKFIAYAERRIASTGFGVLGFITDHSYLDGDTFPGLRHHLLTTFSSVDVLNLHGNLGRREAPPDGGADDNVFNIVQGVAILCARRTPDAGDGLATFRIADLWGARGPKLQRLRAASEGVVPIAWLTDVQHDERFLFIAAGSGTDASVEFAQFDAIDAVFSPNGRPAPGFLTTHDDFAIAFTRDEISEHVTTLLATKSEADARDQFKLCTQSQWQYANAKKVLATGGWRKQLASCLYRPFDERWTVYDPSVLVHRRERVNAHLLEPGNVALLTTRMTKGDDFSHVFLSDKITEVISLSSETSANAFVFPLFLRDPDGLVKRNQPNIDRQVAGAYTEIAREAATPMAMFEYWYAVLSSPSYRRRYNELLIREFPRVPRPSSAEVFKALGEHGKRLIELHLLKISPKSLGANDGLLGKGDGVVAPGMPKFDAKEGKIWINTKQWFAGVSTAVWGFKIGSYEVCKKWLSARRGRSLSSDESRRFALVLNALRETIEEQGKIDRTIESYGGWPDAFRLVGGAVATASMSTEADDE